MNETHSSARMTARIVGILVLGAFLLYGVGSAVATSIVAEPDYLASAAGNAWFTTGAVLMLLNSAAVISIGILMVPILKPHNASIARGYLSTRVFEGTFLALGAISLLSVTAISRESAPGGSDASFFETLGALAINGNFLAYNVAMAGLGLGSLFFCALLFRSRLVPRFLAAWGFVGYASFATGCLLELYGVAGAGLVSTIPGGLFEVFFGIWLSARGFNPASIAAAPATSEAVHS